LLSALTGLRLRLTWLLLTGVLSALLSATLLAALVLVLLCHEFLQ
jgi:hypothetical protein